MKVVACYKVVRDEADLVVAADRTVSFGRTAVGVGDYDLNALEAGALVASAAGGEFRVLTVGGPEVVDTKLRKSVMSRGADGGVVVSDPSLSDASVELTSAVLAAALGASGEFDVVVCGEGSSDRYSQQVGAQLAARLGVPYVNGVSRIEAVDGGIVVDRVLEAEVETLQVSLPAVVSVTSDLNTPRIPSMKDILGAGKKPVTELALADLAVAEPAIQAVVQPERAPETAARASQVFEAGQLAEFLAAVRQVMGKEAK
jgi:electron transfer flavoprotein beta subunit